MEKTVKVLEIANEEIHFDNGTRLYSYHEGDCCEQHSLTLDDLTMLDFEGLEFDLTDEKFFKRIGGYGIELIPISGHSVKIPGHGSNNGYYSDELELILTDINGVDTKYDITECQVICD